MKTFQSAILGLVAMAAAMTTTSAFSMTPSGRSPISLMMSDETASADEAPVVPEAVEAPVVPEAVESPVVPEAVPVPEKHTVYVGNLPFSSTRDQIQDLFTDKGISVVNVAMPMNQNMIDEVTGLPKSKGFCFVDVESEEQIVTAVEAFNDLDMDGRSMRVNKLLPKEEVEQRQNKRQQNYTPDGTYAMQLPII